MVDVEMTLLIVQYRKHLCNAPNTIPIEITCLNTTTNFGDRLKL